MRKKLILIVTVFAASVIFLNAQTLNKAINDAFVITPVTGVNLFAIYLNGVNLGTFAVPSRINIYADGGTDSLTLNGTSGNDAFGVYSNAFVMNGRIFAGFDVESWFANGHREPWRAGAGPWLPNL